jgi:hypothetical protein
MIYQTYKEVEEEFCLLGYDGVWSIESQLTFWRDMPPPSSGLKNKLSCQLHAGFMLGLFFGPEDGGIISQKRGLFITSAVRTSN